MGSDFSFAVCNELFRGVLFPDGCRQIRRIGYSGIEIAPFTLADDPASLGVSERSQIRNAIVREDLKFVGLHWLLAAPEGLHVTAREESVRKRTWNYVEAMVDLCSDLAGANPATPPVVVFGSPNQRRVPEGMKRDEALEIFAAGIAAVAPRAEERGVEILVEALPKNQTNLINSLSEAMAIVSQVQSPAVQTMFDVHNAVDETEPHAELLRRYAGHIRHVHVNELDGREPGMGDYDFATLLNALTGLHYTGWVSVEAFDFSRDSTETAARALRCLEVARPVTSFSQTI